MIARRFPLVICLLALLACGGRDAACSKPAPRTAHEPIPAQVSDQASDPPLPTPPASGNESPPRQGEIAREDRVDEILELGGDPDDPDDVDALLLVARSDANPLAREAAVVLLGHSDDPRALDALIAATRDADSRVVLAALAQLQWSDDRLAEDAVRRLLDSRDAEVARAARAALGE